MAEAVSAKEKKPNSVGQFFKGIGIGIRDFFVNIGKGIANFFITFGKRFADGSIGIQ